MTLKQPNLCETLKSFDNFFGNSSSCKNWPTSFFQDYNEPNETLVNEMFKYGRDNLALIHMAIQNPRVSFRKCISLFDNFVL